MGAPKSRMLMMRNGATPSPIRASVGCSAKMIANIATIVIRACSSGMIPSTTRIETHDGSPVTRAIVSPTARR